MVLMRFAAVLVLVAWFPGVAAAEGFLDARTAAAMQPPVQQRARAPDRETAGFVAMFAGIGLSVAAFDYVKESPVAPGRTETRRDLVTRLRRPALLWAGVGAIASGVLLATVWTSTDRRIAVGPGSLTIRW